MSAKKGAKLDSGAQSKNEKRAGETIEIARECVFKPK